MQRETGVASVIVTHDAEEAAMLAEEVIVLEQGRVLQAGTREELFRSPGSPRVAALLGIANVREGVVLAPGRIASAGAELGADTAELAPGCEIFWCARPERIRVDREGSYEAQLIDDVDLGATRELTLLMGDSLELTVRTSERGLLALGAPLRFALAVADIVIWRARSAADVAHLDASCGTRAAAGSGVRAGGARPPPFQRAR